MTVGLVIVSHSAALAAGVRELAGQMAPEVSIVPAGGSDDGGLGTSFDLVTAGLAEADTGDGVVVLYDLGSAFLTTETAVEFVDPEAADRIVVVDAPLVEGAVAAAVAAQSSADLVGVAAAARAAAGTWGEPPPAEVSSADATATLTVTVADRDGIHARPASILARIAADRTGVVVTIGRSGEPPADLTNVLAVIGLGLRQGEEVVVSGSGTGAEDVVAELAALIKHGLDA